MDDSSPTKEDLHNSPLLQCQKELTATLKKLSKVERKLSKSKKYSKELLKKVNSIFPIQLICWKCSRVAFFYAFYWEQNFHESIK